MGELDVSDEILYTTQSHWRIPPLLLSLNGTQFDNLVRIIAHGEMTRSLRYLFFFMRHAVVRWSPSLCNVVIGSLSAECSSKSFLSDRNRGQAADACQNHLAEVDDGIQAKNTDHDVLKDMVMTENGTLLIKKIMTAPISLRIYQCHAIVYYTFNINF